MRLLLLITDLEFGGTPTVVRELAIALARDPRVHVEVACLARNGPVADQLRAAGIAVTALGARSSTDVSILPKLVRLIHHQSFDTVFSFLIHANVVAAAARIFSRQARLIQSIQTTQPCPRWHWHAQAIVQHAAERIVVPSESVARAARDWAHIPADKISVISNAVKIEDFAEIAAREISHPIRRIGFVGRLDPIKRVSDLVEAMAFVDPQLQLDIYGDGPQRTAIHRQIAAMKLESRVTLHGAVPRPQDAMARIDLLVLPSQAEGFGLVLIEAMASRIPIVATRVAGIRDVIRDGVTGVMVPPGEPRALADAIRRVAGDVQLRNSLIDAAAADVRERFSWDQVLKAYRKLLHLA